MHRFNFWSFVGEIRYTRLEKEAVSKTLISSPLLDYPRSGRFLTQGCECGCELAFGKCKNISKTGIYNMFCRRPGVLFGNILILIFLSADQQ